MANKPRTLHSVVYDWLAPLYDLGVWFLGLLLGGEDRFRDKVIAAIEPLEGKKVLEVFAGTATLSLKAAKHGAKATALDISEGMLGVAREKAKRAGVVLELTKGDAGKLPFEDGSFDRVIISLGLHETEVEKIPPILKEAYRVLKGGGKLVIFDFYRAEGLAGFMESVFFVFFEGETAKVWVRMDLQELLSGIGFKNFNRQFLLRRIFQVTTAEKKV